MATATLDSAATRVAALLMGLGGDPAAVSEPGMGALELEQQIVLRPLAEGPPPADVWAVDGGQALVADARCLQVVVTRASRVRFRAGGCVLEEEGELRAHVLGGTESRTALATLDLAVPAHTAVDINLLRDRWEWDAVGRCVEEAEPGALVLVDGDLQPDWRIPSAQMAGLLERAEQRDVLLAGVTKHSSLARGGAPLLGQLEIEAGCDPALGPRALWWARLGRTRPDVGYGLQVVAARLDRDARFAFRVDLPAEADAEQALAAVAAVSDDAAFPGYPYPLTVADRMAACPGWVREEAWLEIDDALDRAGVPPEVRERAFADRHRLMERA